MLLKHSGLLRVKTCFITLLFLSFSATVGAVDPDTYEEDDTFEKATVIILNDKEPQFHNFHDAGDEDWVIFYGLKGYPYNIEVNNPGSSCNAVIDLYSGDGTTLIESRDSKDNGEEEFLSFKCEEDSIYYVKVKNYDQDVFGENTHYDLQIDNSEAPGLLVLITGAVTDLVTGEGIDGVSIRTNGGGSSISTGGEYDLYQKPGTWTLEAHADGFASYFGTVDVTEEELIKEHPIQMVPITECESDDECYDSNLCTDDSCSESGKCEFTKNTAPCDDDVYCNGIDICSGGICGHSGNPCPDDGLFCNGDENCDEENDFCISNGDPCPPDLECDEENDVCVGCIKDADCDDGLFCNGTETCVEGVCQSGADPCLVNEYCDEENDICVTVSLNPYFWFQSRWIPLPLFLNIVGSNTKFDNSTKVTFNPGSAVASLPPLEVEEATISIIGLLMPLWATGHLGSIEVTVTLGSEELIEVSATLDIELLPFIFKNKNSNP